MSDATLDFIDYGDELENDDEEDHGTAQSHVAHLAKLEREFVNIMQDCG